MGMEFMGFGKLNGDTENIAAYVAMSEEGDNIVWGLEMDFKQKYVWVQVAGKLEEFKQHGENIAWSMDSAYEVSKEEHAAMAALCVEKWNSAENRLKRLIMTGSDSVYGEA